jgi:hypothetical protein
MRAWRHLDHLINLTRKIANFRCGYVVKQLPAEAELFAVVHIRLSVWPATAKRIEVEARVRKSTSASGSFNCCRLDAGSNAMS